MNVLVYENGSGISVVHPAPGFMAEDCIKDVPEGKDWTAVDVSILPDRYFRGAWKLNGSSIDHDIAKVKEIAKDKIRSARKPKLEQLDVEFMQALEAGADTSNIVTKKQQWRDSTDEVNSLQSVNTIKNKIIEIEARP